MDIQVQDRIREYARACYDALTVYGDGCAEVYWDGDEFVVIRSGCAPHSATFRHLVDEAMCGSDSIGDYTETQFVDMVVACHGTELARDFADADITD